MTFKRPKPPKYLRWLTPLLLVSIGLHGLGLLIPVPEPPEPPEITESEAIESISVSTLPPTLESKELSDFVPPPDLPPPDLPPPAEPLLIEEPPLTAPELLEEPFPETIQELEQEATQKQEQETTQEQEQETTQEQEQETTQEQEQETTAQRIRRTYDATGTSTAEGRAAYSKFLQDEDGLLRTYGLSASRSMGLPRTILDLNYVDPESCFEPGFNLSSDVTVGVIVSGGIVEELELFTKVGDAELNAWVEKVIFGDPDAIAKTDNPNINVYELLAQRANSEGNPLSAETEGIIFKIRVTFPDQPC